MDPQVKPFIETIDQLHEDIFKAVQPLSDEDINWKHPYLTNTVGILLRHVAGSERYWIIEVVSGQAIYRKRDLEFDRGRLEKSPLVANLRSAQKEVTAAVGALSAPQLLEEIVQTYRDLPRRLTKSWAILHSIQHTAYHLGQIQLFAKMATKGAAAPMPPGR